MEQLAGNISTFMERWEPDDLVGAKEGEATKVTQVRSSRQNYLNVDSMWFEKYIDTQL